MNGNQNFPTMSGGYVNLKTGERREYDDITEAVWYWMHDCAKSKKRKSILWVLTQFLTKRIKSR